MTGLLIVMFVPVFSSYKSSEALKVAGMEDAVSTKNKMADSLLKASIFQNTESVKKTTSDLDSLEKVYINNTAVLSVITQVKGINSDNEKSNAEIKELKHPLESYRLKWLLGALGVIIIGLLFANRIATKKSDGWGAMKYPQLVLGMLAIFVYVGVEVAIGSNLSELLKQKEFGGFSSSEAAKYISMYWGSLMIGRWAGAVSAFKLSDRSKLLLQIIVPLIAFGVIIGLNTLAKYDMRPLYYYIICVIIQIIAFYVSKNKPARTLMIFGVLGIIAMVIGTQTTGTVATYAFLSGGLFCSIMWPCIFTLSIAGLGKYTTEGSRSEEHTSELQSL